MGSNLTKGLALVVLGLLINNFSFLSDIFLGKHDGWIFLGEKSQAGVAVGAAIAVVGLFLIWKESKKTG